MELNSEQRRAVEHGEGPLLILAGAGSGKTRVITHRIAHLIKNCGVEPERILAVTFTNKAAREMRRRVEGLLGQDCSSLWIQTFHSASLRILRQHAELLGYLPGFVVYDERDQRSVVKRCMKGMGLDIHKISPDFVVDSISRAKDCCITSGNFWQVSKGFFSQQVGEIYERYSEELKKSNAMDFGDLLMQTVFLFKKNPDLLSMYEKKFQHILVDEYQDTNHVQRDLINLLGKNHRNVCVVGDDDQSIYKFRGADITNILEFEEDFPGTNVIKLEQNYRSTQNILTAASGVVSNNVGRREKTLWTSAGAGEKLFLNVAMSARDEVNFVLDRVAKFTVDGIRYDDIAIFYRTNAQSRVFEDELRKRRIPYTVYGGAKFYERKEIKDVVAYLRILNNIHDLAALMRIINTPPRGIGETTLKKVEYISVKDGIYYFDALKKVSRDPELIGSKGRTAISSFVTLIEGLREEVKNLGLLLLLSRVLERSGYLKMFREQKTMEAEERLENVEELVQTVKELKESDPSVTLESFLDQVALVSDIDSLDEGMGVLPLMTMHLAKGLEFSIVFMVGMEDGLFPHSRSLDSLEDLEEERRLCYVGMTRARERLFLSYARRRILHGTEQYNIKSRFLDEVPAELLECKSRGDRYLGEKVGSRYHAREVDWDDFDQRPDEERENGLKNGTKIIHPTLGRGVVRRVEGSGEKQKVIVQFDTGDIKRLMVKYANLEIA